MKKIYMGIMAVAMLGLLILSGCSKPKPQCSVTSWSPDTSTISCGATFTQTSNCGTTRNVVGTKDCASSNEPTLSSVSDLNKYLPNIQEIGDFGSVGCSVNIGENNLNCGHSDYNTNDILVITWVGNGRCASNMGSFTFSRVYNNVNIYSAYGGVEIFCNAGNNAMIQARTKTTSLAERYINNYW